MFALLPAVVSMGLGFASSALEIALASKQKVPPVDRGRLDDIRISIAGYNEHILKGWGKFRGAPVWIWDSRVIHTTITTPGQSGGKGPPKPPTPETVDHIYTKSLAGVCHDGIVFNDITRIWFDLDLVYNGNLFTNSADFREAEFATLAGGANVVTSSVCSNGRKVTGLGNGGTATFAVNIDSGGSYEIGISYLSASDLTFKVSVNGGAAQDVVCVSSGGTSIVAYQTFTATLSTGANTIEFANALAACPDLDRIQVAPALIIDPDDPRDRRIWTGIQDPSRIFPTNQDQPWPFQNENFIPIDGYGTSNGASRVGSSANLTKWGSPTIRLYQGTTTQDPDSAIVTDKGAGNVPGYHDFAYLVLESLQLQNGRLPNVTVEIDQGTREVTTIVEDIYRLCGVDSTNLELSQLNGLILGDTEGFSEGTYADITWAGVVNATTGAGGSFAKSGGGDGWTSYANSGASIAAGTDYSLRFTLGAGVGMMGFATTNTPGNTLPNPYDQMPFAVLWNVDSNPSQEAKNALQMSLGGSNNTSDIGTWAPGDQIQVEIRDGSFYAYQNGSLLTGFVTPVPSYPLKVVVMGYKPIGDPDGGGVSAASEASGANIGSRPTITNAGALVVATRRPASEILGDLMTRFQFDMVNVDGKEKAILRNASSVDITIPYADLRAHMAGEEMPAFDCEILDVDPLLLPHRVDVVYLDPQLDYHTNVQSDMLASGPQKDILNISLSIVDSADNAKKLATTLLNKAHMESRAFKFKLGPKYLHTMPGTIASLQLPNATHTVRFTQWKAQLPVGVIEVEAVRHAASIYSPTATGSISSGYEAPIVAIVGNTEGIILDGPLLRPEDAGDGTQPVVYVGGCHRGAGTSAGFFFYMEYPINSGNYQLVTGGNFDKEADIGVGSSAGSSPLTAYPSAGKPGTTTVDGEIYASSAVSYAAAHDAATGTGADQNGTSALNVQNDKSGATYTVNRSLVFFDTSSIPDDATITSATLSLYATAKGSADSDSISIVDCSIVSNVDYAVADFDLFGTTKQAADLTIASITTSAYNVFTLNAAGLASINKSGITKFGIRTAQDVANTAPTGSNYTTFSSADVGGTAQDPKLIVTYAVPALPSVSDPSVWDRTSSITVDFYTDVALTSQTEQDILANPTLNLFAVQNPSTFAVEYVQAATVSSSAATAPYKSRYSLSTLLRGRVGTDNNVGAHSGADKVCVVNSALKPMRMAVQDIGR